MEIDEKYFQNNDKDNVKDVKFEDRLKRNEKILWKSSPKKISYALSKTIGFMVFALIWLLFDIGFLIVLFSLDHVPNQVFYGLIPFFILHLIPVWACIGGFIKNYKYLSNCVYYITNFRVVAKSGMKGQVNFDIPLSEIAGVQLKENLLDMMYGVGDIYINGKNSSAVLFDIHDSKFVYSRLEQIVNDFKNKNDENIESVYKKPQICEYCGSHYSSETKKCPICGAINKQN